MNSERIQMDLVPCKSKQFRIRSRVNTMIKMDRIQNYPDSFGSDLYPLPCKRGLRLLSCEMASAIFFELPAKLTYNRHMVDISVQNTLSTLQNQPKMRTNCLVKKDFKLENYLTEIKNANTRKTISKFRLSDHKLEIETGRYHIPKKATEQRLCKSCGVTEDEIHCIITCKIIQQNENKLLPKYQPMIRLSNILMK